MSSDISDQIDRYTALGSIQLQQGHADAAIRAFELACNASKLYDTDDVRRQTCTFNLGAALIAVERPQQGLKVLQSVLSSLQDGRNNPDLFYNCALAYQLLGKPHEAIEYFERSLKEYGTESGTHVMQATVACKLAELYDNTECHQQAARYYGIAADAYRLAGDVEEQSVCLYCRANSLELDRNFREAIAAADECMRLCQQYNNPDVVGKLYNEIGLLYAKCRQHSSAKTSFELALPLVRRVGGSDRKWDAVILQNIGAIYNGLGDYQKSINFHETAAALHVKRGSSGRLAQGQCFLNMAFAYSQMDDIESAGEYYLHALQAAKDTDDKQGKWEALEGLGTVRFNQHRINQSLEFFKKALAAMSACSEETSAAQERIVGKLTFVLERQLQQNVDYEARARRIQQTLNDLKPLELVMPEPGQETNSESTTDGTVTKPTPQPRISPQSARRKSNKSAGDLGTLENKEKVVVPERDETEEDDDDAAMKLKAYERKMSKQDEDDEDNDDEGNDDNDDDNDEDESEDDQTPASMPNKTAPLPPSTSSKKNVAGTYERPQEAMSPKREPTSSSSQESGVKSINRTKYSEPSAEDPTYQTIRIRDEKPPTLPQPRPQDKQSSASNQRQESSSESSSSEASSSESNDDKQVKSQGGDKVVAAERGKGSPEIKLPTKQPQKNKPSKACNIM